MNVLTLLFLSSLLCINSLPIVSKYDQIVSLDFNNTQELELETTPIPTTTLFINPKDQQKDSGIFIDDLNQTNNNYPTVLLHGVLANKDNMNDLKNLLELNFKIKVYNLEIGSGTFTSMFTDMNTQLKMLCELIYSMDELKEGFNFIGMSQGGLLARGYVQYCNKYPVKNLITLVSPNGGVFDNSNIAKDFYQEDKQKELSITNYWRDPYRYKSYLTNSTYLAKLNHEVEHIALYMIQENNLDVLENFIMVWSTNDEVIEPVESAKFSLQQVIDGQLVVVDLFDTEIYQQDKLKLKTLNEENRLFIYKTNCDHSQHREPECFHQLRSMFEKFLL